MAESIGILRDFFSDIFDQMLKSEVLAEAKIYQDFKRMKRETSRIYDKLMTVEFHRKMIKKYSKSASKGFDIISMVSFEGSIEKQDDAELEFISYVNPDELGRDLDAHYYEMASLGGKQAFTEFEIPINFRMANDEVIENALAYNLSLANSVANSFSSEIKFEMIQGLKDGTSIPDLRKRILSVYDKGHVVNVPPKVDAAGNVIKRGYSFAIPPDRYANMISRSEAIRWTAEGRLDAYDQMGVVTKVQLESAGDKRVCPICQAAEGTQYTIEEAHGVLPLHCLGRCTFIPIVDLGTGKPKVPGATVKNGAFFVTAILIRNAIPNKVKQKAAANVAAGIATEEVISE